MFVCCVLVLCWIAIKAQLLLLLLYHVCCVVLCWMCCVYVCCVCLFVCVCLSGLFTMFVLYCIVLYYMLVCCVLCVHVHVCMLCVFVWFVLYHVCVVLCCVVYVQTVLCVHVHVHVLCVCLVVSRFAYHVYVVVVVLCINCLDKFTTCTYHDVYWLLDILLICHFSKNPYNWRYSQHYCIVMGRPAMIHFSTIRYVSWYSYPDTIHDTIRYITCPSPYVLLVSSEVCTADKPSWKHACICCVYHPEYNTQHCSAWIFLVSLFRKSPYIRTKKWREGAAIIEDSAFPSLLMHM